MNHELKTLPCYFEAVLEGRKTFEIRNDRDRGFQAGDTVVLAEHGPGFSAVPGKWIYSGRTAIKRIGYVTAFEQQPGWVVFSLLEPVEDDDA